MSDVSQKRIRLLRILPGRGATPIQCNLEAFNLEYAPSYTALSYTWGRPDPDCRIRINGKSIGVRKNLLRFLSEIQKLPQYSGPYYWIDALCINQSDDIERAQQVGMMAEIYNQAQSVLAWLGPAHSESDAAMKALRAMPPKTNAAKIWRKTAGSGIRRLCWRVYWTRLWVLQELALAQSVILMCGKHQVPLSHLTALLDNEEGAPSSSGFEREHSLQSPARAMISQATEANDRRQMYKAILDTSTLGCSVPHDKVYALLGVVRFGHKDLRPDYSVDFVMLLHDVLRNDWHIDPPWNSENMYSRMHLLCDAVGIDYSRLLEFDLATLSRHLVFDVTRHNISARPLTFESASDRVSQVSLWWAVAHRHQPLVDLWQKIHAHDKYALYNEVRAWHTRDVVSFNMFANSGLFDDHRADERQTLRYRPQDRDFSRIDLQRIALLDSMELDEVYKYLYRKSFSVQSATKNDLLALEIAIRFDCPMLLSLLLDHYKVDPVPFDHRGFGAVEWAVSHRRIQCLELLLRNDKLRTHLETKTSLLDLSGKLEWRFDLLPTLDHSPLKAETWARSNKFHLCHVAVMTDDPEMINLLAAFPWFDFNTSAEDGLTPLGLAIRYCQTRVVQALLKIDVNLDEQYTHGASLIHHAVYHCDVEVVRDLLQAGVDPNLQDEDRRTTLHYAAHRESTYSGVDPDSRVTELLLTSGVDPKVKDTHGNTALHYAFAVPGFATIKTLLGHHEVNANSRNKYGETPLHFGIRGWQAKGVVRRGRFHSFLGCVQQIQQKLDIGARTISGCTVIHYLMRLRLLPGDDKAKDEVFSSMTSFLIETLQSSTDIEVSGSARGTPVRALQSWTGNARDERPWTMATVTQRAGGKSSHADVQQPERSLNGPEGCPNRQARKLASCNECVLVEVLLAAGLPPMRYLIDDLSQSETGREEASEDNVSTLRQQVRQGFDFPSLEKYGDRTDDLLF